MTLALFVAFALFALRVAPPLARAVEECLVDPRNTPRRARALGGRP